MPIGVDFDSRSRKYRARITRKNRVYHLGYYNNPEDAADARQEAERLWSLGKKFKFLHSYTTSSPPVAEEGDFYLYFISLRHPDIQETPERSIRLGVLVQAIKDLLHPSDLIERKDARDWIKGKYPSEPGFSFLEIVEYLNIDDAMMFKAIKKACRNRKETLRQIGRRLVRVGATPDY